MTKCQATTKTEKPCTRNAHKNNFCKQHGQAEKIAMFKKELSKMHARVRTYVQRTNDLYSQIDLIQRLDWIKFNLIKIGGPDQAFKYTVVDYRYKDQLEDLFNVPFRDIPDLYQSMLERRNYICHRYTSALWTEKRNSYPSHNHYLTSLFK